MPTHTHTLSVSSNTNIASTERPLPCKRQRLPTESSFFCSFCSCPSPQPVLHAAVRILSQIMSLFWSHPPWLSISIGINTCYDLKDAMPSVILSLGTPFISLCRTRPLLTPLEPPRPPEVPPHNQLAFTEGVLDSVPSVDPGLPRPFLSPRVAFGNQGLSRHLSISSKLSNWCTWSC